MRISKLMIKNALGQRKIMVVWVLEKLFKTILLSLHHFFWFNKQDRVNSRYTSRVSFRNFFLWGGGVGGGRGEGG